MEKKEKEAPKIISIMDVGMNGPGGKYVLDEEAYIGMIDEYGKYREYILDMLAHVENLAFEMWYIYKPKGGCYEDIMLEMFDHIRKHRRVEKEICYDLYKMRNILEKMKDNRKGMKLGKFTIIEPWWKSPLEEIVKTDHEVGTNGEWTFHYCGKKPWTLDWKAYEIMLEQFIEYREVVMESLKRTVRLDGVDGDPDDMFWELTESRIEMEEEEEDAVELLKWMVDQMNDVGGLNYPKKPKDLVKLVPFPLCGYDNRRWVKMG
jgi:hypothetical protein